MFTTLRRAIPVTLMALASFGAAPAGAADADFFKDKTVNLTIGYGFGGSYGMYARAFAGNLGRHIPGHPTVVVKSMPGAGGMKMVNFAHSVMPRDGYDLFVPPDIVVINQLMRPGKMRFDAREFTWLGASNQTNSIMVVRSDTGIKSISDMKRIKVTGGTSGKASNGYISPMAAIAMLGLQGHVITGYEGSAKTILAMEQGEVQMASFNWQTWRSKVPHWFGGDRPFARAILQIGTRKDPDLPDVPMLSDMVSGPDNAIVAFISTAGALGRGVAVPPKTPRNIIVTLRKAYDAMNADAAFEADLKKLRLRLIPTRGETLQKIVNDAISNANPEIVKRASGLIFGTSG
jgi:tripartite-type tricarboxylate transporter receptor subunit TctC